MKREVFWAQAAVEDLHALTTRRIIVRLAGDAAYVLGVSDRQDAY